MDCWTRKVSDEQTLSSCCCICIIVLFCVCSPDLMAVVSCSIFVSIASKRWSIFRISVCWRWIVSSRADIVLCVCVFRVNGDWVVHTVVASSEKVVLEVEPGLAFLGVGMVVDFLVRASLEDSCCR